MKLWIFNHFFLPLWMQNEMSLSYNDMFTYSPLTLQEALMKSTESHEPQQDASELVYSPDIIGFALE